MTLTGMKSTSASWSRRGSSPRRRRARADLQARPGRLDEEAAWIKRYRQLWDARFDELDKVVGTETEGEG